MCTVRLSSLFRTRIYLPKTAQLLNNFFTGFIMIYSLLKCHLKTCLGISKYLWRFKSTPKRFLGIWKTTVSFSHLLFQKASLSKIQQHIKIKPIIFFITLVRKYPKEIIYKVSFLKSQMQHYLSKCKI